MSKTVLGTLWVSLWLTGSALASPSASVYHLSGYYGGSGGEYTLIPDAELRALTGLPDLFESFTVEKAEFLSTGLTYDAQLQREALLGGRNDGAPGPAGGDPLDPRTAYLYTQFLAGTLAGYNYTPGAGRATSAKALQEVIWNLENEAAYLWSAGSLQDTFYTDAQDTVASGAWTGLGNVWVLSLYAAGHGGDLQYRARDMLVTVTTVPAPGAVLLTSLGAGLVGWLRRRSRIL